MLETAIISKQDCIIKASSVLNHEIFSIIKMYLYIKRQNIINIRASLQISLANTSIEVSLSNLRRLSNILFPPSPETLSKMCQQGFNDALHFLYRNNLFSCGLCIDIQASISQPPRTECCSRREIIDNSNFDNRYGNHYFMDTPSAFVNQDVSEVRDTRCNEVRYEEWEQIYVHCQDCHQQREVNICYDSR